ncbi:hypothetical protein ACI1US_00535 [Leucobacter sp. BZR 635]
MLRRAPKALLPVTAIAAALALTLAGCSSKPGSGKELEEGPLQKYMSAMWDDSEFSEEKYAEQDREIEDLVAVCMQDEGFEYKPNVQTSGGFVSFDDDEIDFNSKEFAEQYGYGAMTNPWNEQAEQEEPEEYVDPNGDYYESLSESERMAWDEALYGVQPTEEEWAEIEASGEPYMPDPSEQGCYGTANDKVRSSTDNYQEAMEDPEFAELFEDMQNVYMEMESSDEMQKLNSDWASCMADSGYPDFKTPADGANSIYEAQQELFGWNTELAEGEDYKEPSKDEQDKLKKLEIETAVADFECKDKFDYNDKSSKFMIDIEQKFVDENKAKLDAMLAKYSVKSDSKSEEK